MEFTENNRIRELQAVAESFKQQGKRFSDIEDAEGYQYVDLVQEGGGVLGIALVGYTYILEKAGIRFCSLAGTSAGAINTILLAGLGGMQEAKSERILEILAEKDLFEFVDGDPDIAEIIQKLVDQTPIKKLLIKFLFNLGAIRRSLLGRLGLNPGDSFEEWIHSILSKEGIQTLGDLEKCRNLLPAGLKNSRTGDAVVLNPKLAIIASEITTKTKVCFPEMADLYWTDPSTLSPAKMVRASMSIPYFFEPLEISGLPASGKSRVPEWMNRAEYYGKVPPAVMFVDGGLLSNFPINIFHRSDGGVPRLPTFGVRLSAYRNEYIDTGKIGAFTFAIINTMRHDNDVEFLIKNPDYKQLICKLGVDQEFNWLDFRMPREEQVKLFIRGAEGAVSFLKSFDWEHYRETRRKLANISASGPQAVPV